MTNEITINDAMPFAALSVAQAKEIICGLVSQEIKNATPKQEKQISDLMTTDQAIEFLKEQGFPITKSSIYNKTFKGTIPFRKVGKRAVFSRTKLLQWLDSRTNYSMNGKQ